jgi:hypothetical protein
MIRIRAYLSLHDWASSRQCCIALSLTNDTEVIRRQVSSHPQHHHHRYHPTSTHSHATTTQHSYDCQLIVL